MAGLITNPQEALAWFEARPGLSTTCPTLTYTLVFFVTRYARVAGRTAVSDVRANRIAGDRGRANDERCRRNCARVGDAGRLLLFSRPFRRRRTRIERSLPMAGLLSPIATNSVLRAWAVTDLQRGEVDAHAADSRRCAAWSGREARRMRVHCSTSANLSSPPGSIPAARQAARAAKETYARVNSSYLVLVQSNLAAYAHRSRRDRRSPRALARSAPLRRNGPPPAVAHRYSGITHCSPRFSGITSALSRWPALPTPNTFRAAKCGRLRSVALTNA